MRQVALLFPALFIIYSTAFAQKFLDYPASANCSHQGKHLPALPERLFADQSRSDTIDVLDYAISLDISNLSSKSIQGNCELTIVSQINGLTEVNLDLLTLDVDSVWVNGSSVNHSHTGELLTVNLPSNANQGDTILVKVFYGGQPVMDASGWGGFYFSGNYAFNLGVGFAADPHNYGRVWFPCVDNFVDRATYSFTITTDDSHMAICNGLMQGEVDNGNGTKTWAWQLNQEVPTYLVSVAVSNYTKVEYDYDGIASTYPVLLGAQAADTVKFKNSFINLPGNLAAFENAYGPYRFDRVGFVLVPFSSGAMEHATNIAYPLAAANGSLQRESLMAHELSHHWWGDLVTCETAEDMWINEGWASYSEQIFFEYVYGKERYKEAMRANHLDVLQFAHVNDAGFRAISGVPHEFTYGDHVYNKGADVAHTLRGYLGDDIFFDCISDFLIDHQFQDVNSEEFRDYLSTCAGMDLTAFFDNWVFAKGFPHFSIDSVVAIPSGNQLDVLVAVRQKLRQAPEHYDNVPLEITFFDENWDTVVRQLVMSGSCGTYHTVLDFEPVFTVLDFEERISDAITDRYMVLKTLGSQNFGEALFTLDVNALQDSALVRIEHNWVFADPLLSPQPGLHISQERYWTVDGIFPAGFQADGLIRFNGTNSSANGYLDNNLITNSEDSIVLLYRASVKDDWSVADSFIVNPQGNANNKIGLVNIYGVQKGQYALAIYDHSRADSNVVLDQSPCKVLTNIVEEGSNEQGMFELFPNPATDSFSIRFSQPLANDLQLIVHSMNAQQVFDELLSSGTSDHQVATGQWESGVYLISMVGQDDIVSKKLILIE